MLAHQLVTRIHTNVSSQDGIRGIYIGHSLTNERGNGPCRIGTATPLQDMILRALSWQAGMVIFSWSKSDHRAILRLVRI